jgi:hypothetical protein
MSKWDWISSVIIMTRLWAGGQGMISSLPSRGKTLNQELKTMFIAPCICQAETLFQQYTMFDSYREEIFGQCTSALILSSSLKCALLKCFFCAPLKWKLLGARCGLNGQWAKYLQQSVGMLL